MNYISKIVKITILIFTVVFSSCSSETDSKSTIKNSKVDSLTKETNNLKTIDSLSLASEKSDVSGNISRNDEILEDAKDCIGTQECSASDLITKVKNRHNKKGNTWDITYTGGSQLNSYIDNGQWLFDVMVLGEMLNYKDSFYIVVSTDCDCNITSIKKRSK